jgi:hypothetical protein
MKASHHSEPTRLAGRPRVGRSVFRRWIAALLALGELTFTAQPGTGGNAPALTEYQVKALFLLNFTKYVEWPDGVFSQTSSPVIIGVLGDENFGGMVKVAVQGKTANGRPIEELTLARGDDCGKCQILFISAAEKRNTKETLDRVRTTPVLTVGETDKFTELGGIINFTLKDGKVGLEIDLNSARLAKLQVSSKLLSVAGSVRGKP